ncbi:hypothetical protein B0H14DRAFT_2635778 [Mycena olivaceomarginata]|nr:hypothetical protein B0H14DRAFT_2635778 [Mycena olivaceomarginata]
MSSWSLTSVAFTIQRAFFFTSGCSLDAFSGLRDVSEDFTLQEAILIVPELRAKMQAAVLTVLNTSDYKKQASGYSHTYFTKDDINFGLLSQYPRRTILCGLFSVSIPEISTLPRIRGSRSLNNRLLTRNSRHCISTRIWMSLRWLSRLPQLQQMVDSLTSAANISRAGDEELDACVMASVALALEDLAKIEDLPESNPERLTEIQGEIAHAMSTQPTAFVALLQGMANMATSTLAQSAQEEPIPPPSSKPLVDVSSSDLVPLVELRREHQTREERMGVRTYKSSGTYKNPKTRDQERGSSTGLNRTMRWTGTTGSDPPAASKTGNAANAELAAGGPAKEAMKRRRTIFGKIKCISRVTEAMVPQVTYEI